MIDKMENSRLGDYIKNMRKTTPWKLLTGIAGISFILLTLYRMFKDIEVMGDEPVIFTVLLVALILSGRYVLMLFAQAALKKNDARTDNEKLEKYFARTFVFWLVEGIIYIIFTLCFLLLVLQELRLF